MNSAGSNCTCLGLMENSSNGGSSTLSLWAYFQHASRGERKGRGHACTMMASMHHGHEAEVRVLRTQEASGSHQEAAQG